MKIFFGLLIVYLLVCLILYFVQEKFIFFPETLREDYPFDEFPDAEEFFLEPEKDTRLNVLHFKTEKPKAIVLYFHGNARAMDDWGHRATYITKWGCDVFMADYRTYGKSRGDFSEAAFHKDALFLYNFLIEKYDASDIILYGCSLGSGVATQLGSKVPAKLLILETPFLSMVAVAQSKLPFLPIGSLLKYRFRNDLNIKHVNYPIHIFHGTEDELIPYKQAVALTALNEANARLTTIPGGTHNDIPTFEVYHEEMGKLLKH